MPIECTIAATLLHLNTVFNVSSFYLSVPSDGSHEAEAGWTEGEGVVSPHTIILLRLLSTEYAVTTTTTTSGSSSSSNSSTMSDQAALCFTEAVKVGYIAGTPTSLSITPHLKITGREARVPLQYHELVEILALLRERGALLGSSTYKGHSAAYLAKAM